MGDPISTDSRFEVIERDVLAFRPVLEPQENDGDDTSPPKSRQQTNPLWGRSLYGQQGGFGSSTGFERTADDSAFAWQDQGGKRQLPTRGAHKPKELGVKVTGRGTAGQETGDKIAIALEGYNAKNSKQKLGLSYKDGNFTVENSSHLSKDDLQVLISQQKYSGWHPKIGEKNKDGNWQIGLSPFAPPLEGLKGKPLEFSDDHATSKEVPQGGATIAKESDKVSHLQTYGMGPCVGCTLYNKKTKIGALAHIDTTDKAKSLQSVIDRFKKLGLDPKSLQASIHGGDKTEGSDDTFRAIQGVLKRNGVNVTHASQGNGFQTSRMQLDLSTGKVTTYDETTPYMNDPQNQERLLQQSKMSLFSSKLSIDDQVSGRAKE